MAQSALLRPCHWIWCFRTDSKDAVHWTTGSFLPDTLTKQRGVLLALIECLLGYTWVCIPMPNHPGAHNLMKAQHEGKKDPVPGHTSHVGPFLWATELAKTGYL